MSFRSQLCQFEWNVVPIRLQSASSESSLLMRVMNQALTVGLESLNFGPANDSGNSCKGNCHLLSPN